jgi:hypothetical protein
MTGLWGSGTYVWGAAGMFEMGLGYDFESVSVLGGPAGANQAGRLFGAVGPAPRKIFICCTFPS